MKRNKYLVLTIALYFTSVINAQQITWGTQLTDDKKTDGKIAYIIGNDNAGFFKLILTLNHPGTINATFASNCTMIKYDFQGNQLFSKDMVANGATDGKPMCWDQTFYMKDNLVSIMYDNGVQTCYGMKVGFNGAIDTKQVKIGDVENSWKKEILAKHKYVYAVAPDSTKFLAYYHNKKSTIVELKCFDENLNLLWAKQADFKFMASEADVEECMFNGDQAFFMFHILDNKSGTPNYFTIVYNCKTGTVTPLTLDIKSKEDDYGSGGNLGFCMDKTGDAIFCSTYGTKQSKGSVTGLFYARIDHNGKDFALSKSIDFSPGFMEYFINDREISMGRGIEDLHIKELHFTNDGSMIFAAEQVSILKSTFAAAVIGKITPDGSLVWVKKIAKKQYRTIYTGYSYMFEINNTNGYLVFNDNIKNEKLDPEQAARNDNMLEFSNAESDKNCHDIILVTLDLSSGALTKTSLSPDYNPKMDLIFDPYFDIVMDPSTILVYRYSKKEKQYGRLKLK